MPNWLEVSLTVDGELAEAVADVLARFAPNGVMTEQAVDFTNDEDEGTPVGPITVRVLSPDRNPLAATTIEGDSLHHEVRFGDRSLRDLVPDGRFRLQFEFQPPGALYSFTIR